MLSIFVQSAKSRVLTGLILLAVIGFYQPLAHAGQVTRSKGRAVEIELSSTDDFVKGDKLYLARGNKKVGLVEVVKFKNGKVIAKLLKGKAPAGATTRLRGKGGEKIEAGSEDGPSGLIVGVLIGYNMNTQKVTTTESVNMTGGSYSLKAAADYALAGDLGIIARAGIESFSYKGNGATTNNAYKTTLTYLSGDLLVRYILSPGTYNPYVSGGIGFAFPVSTSSNILDTKKVNPTTPFYIGAGAMIALGKKAYVPVSLEYAFLPASAQVKTNWIALRAGYMWNF